MLRSLTIICGLPCGAALRLPTVLRESESALSRRAFGAQAATGLAALALGSTAANAEEEPSRMGGILEPYIDAPRGFKLLKPSGWNKVRSLPPPPHPHVPQPAVSPGPNTKRDCRPCPQFDVDPGVYDVKFQDLIDPFETVQARPGCPRTNLASHPFC